MSPSDRYSRTAIALHWLIALAVIGQFAWGWWMQDIPKQPPGPRVDAFNLHKSIGLTILALMCVRVALALAASGAAAAGDAALAGEARAERRTCCSTSRCS